MIDLKAFWVRYKRHGYYLKQYNNYYFLLKIIRKIIVETISDKEG